MRYSSTPEFRAAISAVETPPQIDGVADPEDKLEIEVQKRSTNVRVLYVHVNGQTILRVQLLEDRQISLTWERT